jgi:ABC-type transport system involved in multi-copper enzyme maturation permease subunit
MALARDVMAVARLYLAEVSRSRWLLFCGGLYAVLAGGFMLVGLRESSILGFTGMGRVLTSFCHALLLVLPLLALTGTGQVVIQARESGALEMLFSHPFTRAGYYLAVTLVRYLVLLLPLVGLMLALVLYAHFTLSEPLSWGFLSRTIAVSAALLWAFVGFGILISTAVRRQTRAQTYVLLTYAASIALLDFALVGAMLQWRLRPEGVFVLAALNPVEAARMALLSSADPELSVLGPVGFFLATRLGPARLFALGVLWPLLAGTLAWLAGFWRFRRDDLV